MHSVAFSPDGQLAASSRGLDPGWLPRDAASGRPEISLVVPSPRFGGVDVPRMR